MLNLNDGRSSFTLWIDRTGVVTIDVSPNDADRGGAQVALNADQVKALAHDLRLWLASRKPTA